MDISLAGLTLLSDQNGNVSTDFYLFNAFSLLKCTSCYLTDADETIHGGQRDVYW